MGQHGNKMGQERNFNWLVRKNTRFFQATPKHAKTFGFLRIVMVISYSMG